MQLIKLWEADLEKAFDLYQQFDEDENGFMNEAYGISYEEFPNFVQRRKDNSYGINMRPGRAKSTDYILEDNGLYVGIFKLRHYLNDALRSGAGHIGFGIVEKYRNQGYASKGLGLMIDIAKTIVPEEELYMACYKTNEASLKTQMKHGAYIHHEDEEEFYTRIKIK